MQIGKIYRILLILLFITPGSELMSYASRKNVLILRSFESDYYWTDDIIDGVKQVFNKYQNSDLDIKFLHSRPGKPFFREYNRIKYDIIITTDNTSLQYVINNRKGATSDIPVVSLGTVNFDDFFSTPQKNITGIVETINVTLLLNRIMYFHPSLEKVIVIYDSSLVSKKNIDLLKKAIPGFKEKINFEFFNNITIDKLKLIKPQKKSSVILLLGTIRNNAGIPIQEQNSVKIISKETKVPIYSFWKSFLNSGVVGCLVPEGFSQGTLGAEIAVEILNGRKVDEFPALKSNNQHFIFDYTQIQKYNIDERTLPVNSMIINKPVSFYSIYRFYLWGGVISILVLFIIILLLFINIKRRSKAERELKISEDRLNLALNVVEDGIWDWNITNGKIYFSKRWLEIIGYSEGETQYNYNFWTELIHPEDSAKMQEQLRLHLKGNIPVYNMEYRMLTKNNEWKWILDRGRVVLRDSNGNPLRMIGIHQDISERKIMEMSLQESDTKFRSLVEQSTDGIVLTNKDGIILEWNKSAENITGFTAECAEGKSYWEIQYELLPDEEKLNKDKDSYILSAKQSLEKAESECNQIFDLKFIHPEKGETFIQQVIFPIRSEKGIMIGSIIRDITKRKQIENQIAESERKFRELTDLLPQTVFETDLNGKLTFVNKIAFELFQSSPEEFAKGIIISERIVKEEHEILKDNITNVIKGEKGTHEYTAIKTDGTIFPIRIHSSRVIKDGMVCGLRGILIDISEQKQAEELLRESEERFRSLVENQIEGVGIVDDNENFTYSNASADFIFGVYPDSLIGKNLSEFLDPAQFDLVVKETQKRLKGEKSTYELNIIKSNGEKRIIILNVSPYYLHRKKIKGSFGVFSDITEKKKAEDKLRQLSRAVHQSPNSIVITDVNGNIIYVNPKFTEMTGYSYEEVIGKNPRILKSGEFSSAQYKQMWETIFTGGEWTGEFHNKKKNGDLYWELASISAIKNEEGKITSFIAIKEDITDRKKAEQELIIAKEEAEKSDRLKSEFLAQMSHEIRTPINTILSFTSLLKDELSDKLPEDLKSSFRIIDNGSRRLIRTIDLILDMSRVQTGNFEVYFIEIDLEKEVIENIVFDFISIAKEKKLNLGFKNINVTRKIIGDIYTITQIFSNLIDNAIKYTTKGSINIILSQTENEVSVEVKDTGIGISKSYLPHIFSSFSQEETGYTRRFEGTGLGLALVKKYVELNEAEIEVESQKGEGTTFKIIFKNLS